MPTGKKFVYLHQPDPDLLNGSAQDFLCSLKGPAVIDIAGTDPGRTRVITSLIHGNEPSGLIALHRWLGESHVPLTNLRIILPSTDAAQAEPLFTHRYLPLEEDLNRCFHLPGNNVVVRRAEKVKSLIQEVQPEAVIDLHNTSGSGPSFAVTVNDGKPERALISHFCHRAILTGLRVGSLMEQDFGCPIVTIECGGAADPHAHQIAYDGIKSFLRSDDIKQGKAGRSVEILRHPMRVEVRKHASLAYSTERLHHVDISLYADIEKHNVSVVPEGTRLGWTNNHHLNDILIRDEEGSELPADLFRLEMDAIVTRHDMQVFMATTRADIAHKDCLFYVILEDGAHLRHEEAGKAQL